MMVVALAPNIAKFHTEMDWIKVKDAATHDLLMAKGTSH